MSDWYSVSRRSLANFLGGRRLLREHRSLPRLLAAAYPEIKWDPERFRPAGSCAAFTKTYLLTELDKVAKKMGIEYVGNLLPSPA